MKVYELSLKPQFIPINLILETQEEVNAIRTIVESSQITDVFPALRNWWKQLQPYGDFDKDWKAFMEILRK